MSCLQHLLVDRLSHLATTQPRRETGRRAALLSLLDVSVTELVKVRRPSQGFDSLTRVCNFCLENLASCSADIGGPSAISRFERGSAVFVSERDGHESRIQNLTRPRLTKSRLTQTSRCRYHSSGLGEVSSCTLSAPCEGVSPEPNDQVPVVDSTIAESKLHALREMRAKAACDLDKLCDTPAGHESTDKSFTLAASGRLHEPETAIHETTTAGDDQLDARLTDAEDSVEDATLTLESDVAIETGTIFVASKASDLSRKICEDGALVGGRVLFVEDMCDAVEPTYVMCILLSEELMSKPEGVGFLMKFLSASDETSGVPPVVFLVSLLDNSSNALDLRAGTVVRRCLSDLNCCFVSWDNVTTISRDSQKVLQGIRRVVEGMTKSVPYCLKVVEYGKVAVPLLAAKAGRSEETLRQLCVGEFERYAAWRLLSLRTKAQKSEKSVVDSSSVRLTCGLPAALLLETN